MICLDVNIILEVILNRAKFKEVKKILDADDSFCISLLSVHLFYHFGVKNGLEFSKLDDFLSDVYILAAGKEAYDLAKKIRQDNDFEDALQVATALQNKVKVFYTLDQNLAKNYEKLLEIVCL